HILTDLLRFKQKLLHHSHTSNGARTTVGRIKIHAGMRPNGQNGGEGGGGRGRSLAALEEQDGDLSEVEVDEVLRLVGDVAAEVTPDDAVPGGVVLLVELLLDVGSDVLLDVSLLECLSSAVDRILLHVLAHVGVLDHGLAVSHREGR
ncbi:hypothetical protein PMAYCL1PPCAC_31746, partial [Pristionchus mayeri]